MPTRRQLFQNAISCDVYADSGTPYPCNDTDIIDTYEFSSDNQHRPLSASQANCDLIDHNDIGRSPPSYERDAIRRLSSALDDAERSSWDADLIIKAFLNLDLVFFGGVLRGNVVVMWGDPDGWLKIEENSGFRISPITALGITVDSPPGYAQIVLNAGAIFLNPQVLFPFKIMFTTMLHEMCHAFEFVLVRPDEWDGHGPKFSTRLHTVDRRAKDLLGFEAVLAARSIDRCHISGHPINMERHRQSRGRRY